MPAAKYNWHLGDYRLWAKHTRFDQSLKSALMVQLPNQNKGVVQGGIVSSIEIYPTLMELSGLRPAAKLDGKSFAKFFGNKPGRGKDNSAYSYYNKGISVRAERYRLTRYFRDQEPVLELYKHKTDPDET